MSGSKRFFRDGILLSLVGIGMRTVGLFFGAFVSKAVGASGIGTYTLLTTVYGFAATFATAGIGLTVTRLVASRIGEGREREVGGILRGAFFYALAFSATAGGILFGFAGPLAARSVGDAALGGSLRVLSLSLIPSSLCAVFSGYFVGVKRVTRNAVTQIVTQIFKIAVTVLCLRQGNGGLTTAQACLLLAGVSTATDLLGFAVLFLQFRAERRHQPRQPHGKAEISAVFGMALPLAISAYIRSALVTAEHVLIPKRLLLFGYTEAGALAAYGILHGMALPMILYPMAALTSFSGLLVPEFAADSAAGNRRRMMRTASRAFSATLTYAVAVSVFLCLFAEEIGYLVYHSYEAGRYIAILSPVLPVMYIDHVTDAILKGIGEQVYSMWVNISDAALSVLLVWVLLPRCGIAGYALVIVGMEAYNFALSFWRLRRKITFRVSWKNAFLLPLIAAVLSAGCCRSLFVMNGRTTTAFWFVMKLIFAACLFAAILLFLRALTYRKTAVRPPFPPDSTKIRTNP